MKIYVLIRSFWNPDTDSTHVFLVGIFNSLDKAQIYWDKNWSRENPSDMHIIEEEINKPKEETELT